MSYDDAIDSGETEDGYKWAFYQDESYDTERNFLIYASQGTGRYIPVDQVIDTQNADAFLTAPKVKYYRPLYMLAHSGVSISLGNYRDPWDSGQCGFAVLDEDNLKYAGIEDEDCERYLEQQVEEYDAVLRGNVFYYHIWRDKKCHECGKSSEETISSLSGIVVKSWKDLQEYVDGDIMQEIAADRIERQEAEHAAQKGVQSDD